MYGLPKNVCVVPVIPVCIDVPSIGFVDKELLSLSVILHTMWSVKSMQLLCILPFGILCLSAIRIMFVKIILAVCMFVGIVVWTKANSVSSVNCVQSVFL